MLVDRLTQPCTRWIVEQERLQYVQVRHEQVGALAAAADAKLTGKIGVAFGSAGPGAIVLNRLYDAKEDHVPVLALVGQVAHTNMNYDYFKNSLKNRFLVMWRSLIEPS